MYPFVVPTLSCFRISKASFWGWLGSTRYSVEESFMRFGFLVETWNARTESELFFKASFEFLPWPTGKDTLKLSVIGGFGEDSDSLSLLLCLDLLFLDDSLLLLEGLLLFFLLFEDLLLFLEDLLLLSELLS